jgi:hypothetical protein
MARRPNFQVVTHMGMFTGLHGGMLHGICSDMGQVQKADVTAEIKNIMSRTHLYSSKELIFSCMMLIATRDSETACVRFRESREICSPDSSLQGVYPNFLMCEIDVVGAHSSHDHLLRTIR